MGKNKVQAELQRDIIANNKVYNNGFNYANNHIKTSKYTLITFLPFNLFEQFQRLANFYFLCLLILQIIPVISSLSPVTTAVPLIGVLTLTAIKDAYDDIQRHRTDREVNNRKSQVLRKGQNVEEKWHRVQVGDVIRMENNQFIAADILILSSNNPNGLCFIETAELDGETNLKSRQCLEPTNKLGDDEHALSDFNGRIICEPPNNNLSRFEGALHWKDKTFPLNNENILLRGAILRNTAWCYGVVIFAGKDTKLMQNSGKTKFKRTSIDGLLNCVILQIVFFLLCMCLFCTIACGVWEALTGEHFQTYLPWETLIPQSAVSGSAVIAILNFFSYAIVLNTVVPISLYVSVEVIRLALSFLIGWDLSMYYKPNDTPAKARTTTLSEELGQIEYIFSDKTGTLTQNIMTFNKCSIGGKSYGDETFDDSGQSNRTRVDFSGNPMYETTFEFYDSNLLSDINNGNIDAQEFFRLLALCHTVMPETINGKLEYQAQSPDENALVSAARNFGFVFTKRTPRSITITFNGVEEAYDLLCILDFNNVRKRMSVILRKDGRIRLYCKGADTIILQRLGPGQDELIKQTQQHLDRFATDGLRTLLLAYKDLTEEEYQEWKIAHHNAAIAMEDREGKLDAVYESIENDLLILGASAIEDKLQDGVAQTIANLQSAGIKIWVLTGDKQETAINIGYSCQLLSDDLTIEPFLVDGETYEEVEKQLCDHRRKIYNIMNPIGIQMESKSLGGVLDSMSIRTHSSSSSSANENQSPRQTIMTEMNIRNEDPKSEYDLPLSTTPTFALVVNGHSLVHALTPKMERLFLGVAESCIAVICCRVTPLQKALVVDLVKTYKKAVTLAIGDGANDVSMIKTAHIGVGISGQEGMQAVLASDYSIAQFKFLERLLLVHGRWSYYRMCKFLRYFFYKNFAFTLCHFWFAFFCGFSAQTLFEPFFIAFYNVFYTSLPVLTMGMFDQDVDSDHSIKYPKLYTPGLNSKLFNKLEFSRSALQGIISSFFLFFTTYGAYYDKVTREGKTLSDHMLIGSVVATNLVVVVTAQIILDTAYWTFFNFITVFGSIAVYFIFQFGYNHIVGGGYIGALAMAMGEWTFWATCILNTVVLIIPILGWRFYKSDVHPTLTEKVRLLQKNAKRLPKETAKPFGGHRFRRSARSGYAFAHQEGFGRLITSGKMMKHSTTQENLGAPQLPGQPSQTSLAERLRNPFRIQFQNDTTKDNSKSNQDKEIVTINNL